MGLQTADLRNLVYDIFEIDSFKSKMGEDKDIVVLSFSVKSQEPANDLMNFLEKGYPFVLDADVTSGEQPDGTYKVFVEMERGRDIPAQITEIVDGVQKLAELDDMKFRYYKNFNSLNADEQNIAETVPLDVEGYEIRVNETNMENYKNFFSKSYLDSIEVLQDNITFKKIYAEPLKFKIDNFGKAEDIQKQITEQFNINSYPEIIYLTKYLGDYNISIYGTQYLIENAGYTLVLSK
ncbi:MAG: hypothetical protein CMA31_00950 [Euryarchaeota archaeon]|nr:hypothetical protein [Euryarchaeota archaeon]|tara:strand:+ start:7 stop:717 length:711 start_codon:yes stop_codon:yes gene_type:complete